MRLNHTKTVTLLRDYLVCGHCGSKFGQKINKSQYYNHYYCRGNSERLRTKTDGLVCTSPIGRVRSLNIEVIDPIVWNHIIEVVSQSSTFKEGFKKEVMEKQTSFGKSMNERKKIRRRIVRVDKTIDDINDSINSIIVDGVVDKNSKEMKPLIKKFEDKKLELLSEKDSLLEELSDNQRSTVWYDWIKDFGDRIDTLKTDEMSVEEKKKFLDGIVERIEVFTKDKQTHTIKMEFKSPYVGDDLVWNEKNNPKKGYKIVGGDTDFVFEVDSEDRRLKKN